MGFNGLLLIIIPYIGFITAYHFYGKYIGQKLFGLSNITKTPAHIKNDGTDYVPSKKGVVFGHHFTSIAGTGPIVGPAIGVIWGWLPALLWVFLGSIFMGAVHDFGILVLSLRHKGQSICEFSDQFLSKRIRLILFFVVFLALLIVIAIFGLVIAVTFNLFPESVFPVWIEIPIAIGFGLLLRRFPKRLWLLSGLAILAMTGAVIFGHFFPINLVSFIGIPATGLWTIVLLIYASIASILPVQTLLQPRDFLNAWQLFIALGLLLLGAFTSGIFGNLSVVAPAFNLNPQGAPSMMPFLFITIACGAISGFHALVSSGTTSKQLNQETDATAIGYGSMIVEGALAIMIIVACCAGLGMGYPSDNGTILTGFSAWESHYFSWNASAGLASKLHAVVIGASNMMGSLGIPTSIGTVIMGVFIASFAGTTLDTSTRLQRHIISELAQSFKIKLSSISATLIAVISAALLAFSSGMSGKGALMLWPLFGALNQLLACIGLGILSIYLIKKHSTYVKVTLIPFLFLSTITTIALIKNQINFLSDGQLLLFVINGCVLCASAIIFYDTIKTLNKYTPIQQSLNFFKRRTIS